MVIAEFLLKYVNIGVTACFVETKFGPEPVSDFFKNCDLRSVD